METINNILKRGVSQVLVEESITKKLKSGRKLVVKYGIDPTTADLHLGYLVIFNKLKALLDLGHQIIILIGDFTARFGDPTDKRESRQLRTKEEVELSAKSYIDQLKIVFDINKIIIKRNSEWYDQMKTEDFIRLANYFTVNRMMERDMFQKRLKQGKEIRLNEIFYPVFQAYDSVVLKSDLTVIGQDQIFNEIQARHLQEKLGQPPQDLIAMDLLLGADGKRKMSQSLGNDIKFTDEPNEMFGKVMSIPDELVLSYFELLTDLLTKEAEERLNKSKRNAKAFLANKIVSIFYGANTAGLAEENFNTLYRDQKLSVDLPIKDLGKDIWLPKKLLVEIGLAKSNTEAQRLIKQKGVEINKEKILDWSKEVKLNSGDVIRVGRKFIKISL